MKNIIVLLFLILLQACGGSSDKSQIDIPKKQQSITFKTEGKITKDYGSSDFINLATGLGAGSISYSTDNTNVATVNANTGKVTVVDIGEAKITASIAEGNKYLAASASYVLTVNKASPKITFNKSALIEADYSEARIINLATSNSDGEISYVSSNNEIATVNPETGVVDFITVGEVTIKANVTADSKYLASSATYQLTINKTTPVISFTDGELIEKEYLDNDFINIVTTNSEGVISYQSSNTDVAVINTETGLVDILAMGEVTITASISQDDNFKALQKSFKLIVNKETPTFVFNKVPEEGFRLVNGGKSFGLPLPNLYIGPSEVKINLWDEYMSYPWNAFEIEYSHEGVISINKSWGDEFPYEAFVEIVDEGESVIKLNLPETSQLNSVSGQFTVKVRQGKIDFSFDDKTDLIADILTPSYTRTAVGGHGTEVSYTTSEPKVAVVDRLTGKVEIKGMGKAIISAVSQGQGAVDSNFDSYSIVVTSETIESPSLVTWTGKHNTEIHLQESSVAMEYVISENSNCDPGSLANCTVMAQGDLSSEPSVVDNLTLNNNATSWFKLNNKSSMPVDISVTKFPPGYCSANLVFKGRLWRIGGRVDDSLNESYPVDPGFATNHVWSSVNGENWKLETESPAFPAVECPQAFVFQNMMWLIVLEGENTAKIWSSTDGIKWQTQNVLAENQVPFKSSEIVLFKDKLFLYGDGEIWSSIDGVSWLQEKEIDFFGVKPIVLENKLFGIVSGYLCSSIDGINWIKVNKLDFTYRYFSHLTNLIVHKNKMWVRLSNSGYDGMFPYSEYWSSTDGINWVNERLENSDGWGDQSYFAGFAGLISFNDQLWIIAPYSEDPWKSTSNRVANSYDGRVWNTLKKYMMCKSTDYRKNNCTHVVYQSQFWQGKNESLYASADGLNWQLLTDNLPTSDLTSLTVFDEKLWLFSQGKSWSSLDGLNWMQQANGESYGLEPYESIKPVILKDEILLLTGQNGNNPAYWRSSDGKTWQFNVLGQDDLLHDVKTVHDNKLWSLVDNKVSYSNDGLSWVEVTSLAHQEFSLVSFKGNLWAFGRHNPDYKESDSYQKVYKLSNSNEWQLITESSDIAYVSHWRGPAFFREMNGKLYYFSVEDEVRSTDASVWRSTDAINWQKGQVLPINFED